MINTNKLINFVLVLFLILLSGSILFMGYIVPTFVLGVFIAIISIVSKKNIERKHFNLFYKSFLLILLVLILNFIFSSSNNFGNYFTVMSLGLYALLVKLSFDVRFQDFTKPLYHVLRFFVIYSLIGFIISQFLSYNIIEIGPTGFRTSTFYYLFYYFSKVSFLGFSFFRNQGFFWEPGVLSVFANIFLFLSIFKFKSSKNTLLASICILTTFSTTGLLLMSLQLFFLLKEFKSSYSKKIFLIFLIAAIFVIGFNSYIEKKNESEIKSISSLGVRLYDIYSGIAISLNNPFFGVGLNKEAYLIERDKYFSDSFSFSNFELGDRNSSNDLVKIFFSSGIFLGFYILYLMYNQNIVEHNKFFFLLVLLICLSGEPLFHTPFFLYIVFNGLQNKIK